MEARAPANDAPAPLARPAVPSVRDHVTSGGGGLQITRAGIGHAAAVLAIWTVQFGFALPKFNWLHRTLSAVLGTVCYLVAIRDIRASSVARRMPFLAISAATYFAFFGLAILWVDDLRTVRGYLALDDDSISKAQLVVLVSFASFVLGYRWLVRPGHRMGARFAQLMPKADLRRGSLGVLLSWAGLVTTNELLMALRMPLVPKQLEFLVSVVLSPSLLLGVLLWWYHAVPTRTRALVLFGVMAFLAFGGLLSGMVGAALRPVMVVGVGLALLTRRIPWRLALIGAAAFIVVQPAKMAYREQVFADAQGRSRGAGVQERVSIWSQSVEEAWQGPASSEKSQLRETMSRTSELMFVVQAVEWVPDKVAYSYGTQWMSVLYSWVPRIVWPDKPSPGEFLSRNYALTFNLQTAESARTTAVNLVQQVDGYWAMGWFGVALTAFVFGALLGLLAGMLEWRTWGQFAIGCVWIVSAGVNGSTAGFLGGLPQALVGMTATVWLVGFALGAGQAATTGSPVQGKA